MGGSLCDSANHRPRAGDTWAHNDTRPPVRVKSGEPRGAGLPFPVTCARRETSPRRAETRVGRPGSPPAHLGASLRSEGNRVPPQAAESNGQAARRDPCSRWPPSRGGPIIRPWRNPPPRRRPPPKAHGRGPRRLPPPRNTPFQRRPRRPWPARRARGCSERRRNRQQHRQRALWAWADASCVIPALAPARFWRGRCSFRRFFSQLRCNLARWRRFQAFTRRPMSPGQPRRIRRAA